MGRRSEKTDLAVVKMRDDAARQLRAVYMTFDIAEFQAQKHAADMVDLLAGFARDPMQDVAFRRTCALDVLVRGYGDTFRKADLQMFNPSAPAPGNPESTIGQVIDAAAAAAADMTILDDWFARDVPIEQWPAHVREIAERLASPGIEIIPPGED